jgi:hypothetical protein
MFGESIIYSWKDEFILLIFSLPIIFSFFPQTKSYVDEGFNALEGIPDWFMYLFVGIVVSIYGLRSLLRVFISKGKV